jgi:hypothetical protein
MAAAVKIGEMSDAKAVERGGQVRDRNSTLR